jgi:glycosyltransferase involved in cell wall biosynthesis
MRRLVIVQPYVPTYRRPFFDALCEKLAEHEVSLEVAAGIPDGAQLQRGDAASGEWLRPIVQRKFVARGHSIGLGGSRKVWRDADAVIVGHLGSSLDTYQALVLGKVRRSMKVGVWGHLKSYVGESHAVDAALERWQLRMADHVFAYTEGGAKYARSVGVSAERLTTVRNTVDTSNLISHADLIDEPSIDKFEHESGLYRGRSVVFVGGMDESKRIGFLAESLDHLWRLDPSIRVGLGGRGKDEALFGEALTRGQAIRLGYVAPEKLAMLGRVSSGMLMPGRIGLIAVECMSLGMPVLTTDWPYHAPEAEYLTEGTTRLTAPNNPLGYAEMVARHVQEWGQPRPASSSARASVPTLEDMVDRYAEGVFRLLDSPRES